MDGCGFVVVFSVVLDFLVFSGCFSLWVGGVGWTVVGPICPPAFGQGHLPTAVGGLQVAPLVLSGFLGYVKMSRVLSHLAYDVVFFPSVFEISYFYLGCSAGGSCAYSSRG